MAREGGTFASMEAKLNVLREVVEGLGLDVFGAPAVAMTEFLASPSAYLLVDIRTDEERR